MGLPTTAVRKGDPLGRKRPVGGSLRACVIVIAGLLAGCGTVNRTKFLLPAPWFGLEAIAPSVLVEKEMPTREFFAGRLPG